MKKFILLFYSFILLTLSEAFSQEIIDGIAVIIGDKIITRSELIQAAQGMAYQNGINPVSQPKKFKKLKNQVLTNLINEKILLIKAEKDTITIEDQKVDEELERRIQQFVQQFGSQENVEQQFGKSITEIKDNYKENIRDGMTIQLLQQKHFSNLTISRNEVIDYFESLKDSLPDIQQTLKLRHILLRVKVEKEERARAMEKFMKVKQELRDGTDFKELAKKYSEDPSTAKTGGDLGYIEKGSLFPSFEEAAFKLKVGEISNAVETPIGLHIIKMVEEKENKVRVHHILFSITITKEDEKRTIEKLQNIKNKVLEGEDFSELAREFSEDESTKENGGDLGWMPPEEIQIEEFRNAVNKLNKGDISDPFKTNFGYHLILVEDKKEGRNVSLEEDWERINSWALSLKQQDKFQEWIEELKKNIYISIKEDLIE